MDRFKILPLALAAAAALGAAAALAGNRDSDSRQSAAAAATKITLQQAIASAAETTAGTLFDARLEDVDGKLVYEIRFADKTGKVSRIFLDSATGKIVPSPEGFIERVYQNITGGDDKAQIDTVRTAAVDLSAAIAKAEQATGGRAFDARVENENGKVLYEVELALKAGAQAVGVDPQTGEVAQLADKRDSENNGDGENGENDGDHEEED